MMDEDLIYEEYIDWLRTRNRKQELFTGGY